MLITTNMWHPFGERRRYESAGSRTSFKERWNPHTGHSFRSQGPVSNDLQLLVGALTDEQKAPWFSS